MSLINEPKETKSDEEFFQIMDKRPDSYFYGIIRIFSEDIAGFILPSWVNFTSPQGDIELTRRDTRAQKLIVKLESPNYGDSTIFERMRMYKELWELFLERNKINFDTLTWQRHVFFSERVNEENTECSLTLSAPAFYRYVCWKLGKENEN